MKTITLSDEELTTLRDCLNLAGLGRDLIPGLRQVGAFTQLMVKLEPDDGPTCANPHTPGVDCACMTPRGA